MFGAPVEGYSTGYATHAYDEKLENQLWPDSLSMVGFKDED
jgi:hypothetical protein